MPRNGSGVYSKPPGTAAVPNTTITSAQFNDTIDDLVQDANTARPITAGGTGATSKADATTGLEAVSYGSAQSLTTAQQGQARANIGADPARTFVTKSANYTALAADKAANIRFDGAYTLSLTAAATLGSGWYCYVQADGGAVTIDPNSSETINGASNLVLPNGKSTIVWCNGTEFLSAEDYQNSWVDGGEADTASGLTEYDFNIPSWAQEIQFAFSGVSTNGSSIVLVQLGDSGGFETTGYLGALGVLSASPSYNTASNGIWLPVADSGAARYGSLTLHRYSSNSNVWAYDGKITETVNSVIGLSSGVKSLSSNLTQVRLTTANGTDTFTQGSCFVKYR